MTKWMRRRGDCVAFTTGKYAAHQGMVESNVYQRPMDRCPPLPYPALYLVVCQQTLLADIVPRTPGTAPPCLGDYGAG